MNQSGCPVVKDWEGVGVAEPYNHKKIADSVLALEKTYDSLFENAPVMLHSIDADGKLLKVNQKWLEELGYEPDEVLGRKSTDFLTAESRARAVSVNLPSFWKFGNVRNVGYQFVAKNGKVLELLLDAERILGPYGNEENLAAIYYHDPGQWKMASSTLRVLSRLGETRRELAGILSGDNTQISNAVGTPGEAGAEGYKLGIEVTASFLKAAQDISANLKALVKTQVELLDVAYEQRDEFLPAVRSIDHTLSELVSLAADAWTVGR
ncbi:MAG: PAS domain S-box protein [Chloroflexi bacterium]|nr:PAS domain S-box protein [Chloroflexota bacterium]